MLPSVRTLVYAGVHTGESAAALLPVAYSCLSSSTPDLSSLCAPVKSASSRIPSSCRMIIAFQLSLATAGQYLISLCLCCRVGDLLRGHTGSILQLLCLGDHLLSLASDQTVRVWKIGDYSEPEVNKCSHAGSGAGDCCSKQCAAGPGLPVNCMPAFESS